MCRRADRTALLTRLFSPGDRVRMGRQMVRLIFTHAQRGYMLIHPIRDHLYKIGPVGQLSEDTGESCAECGRVHRLEPLPVGSTGS